MYYFITPKIRCYNIFKNINFLHFLTRNWIINPNLTGLLLLVLLVTPLVLVLCLFLLHVKATIEFPCLFCSAEKISNSKSKWGISRNTSNKLRSSVWSTKKTSILIQSTSSILSSSSSSKPQTCYYYYCFFFSPWIWLFSSLGLLLSAAVFGSWLTLK